MKLVVTHLTQMRNGAVFVAGLDSGSSRHIRPVVAGRPLRLSDTSISGGPFDISSIVDVGPTRAIGRAPHREDHEITSAKLVGLSRRW